MPGRIEAGHKIRRVLDQRFELGLTPAQLLLCQLALGNVGRDARNSGHLVAFVKYREGLVEHPVHLAIHCPQPVLNGGAFAMLRALVRSAHQRPVFVVNCFVP